MTWILWLYLLGALVTALLLARNDEYKLELVVFCTVFYPIIIALGLLTIVTMLLFALISSFAEAIKLVARGDKNGN